MVKKQQPQLISSSEIQSAIVAEQLNRRGAWNKTISVPLPNFGDNRKVFVKVIEKDIAELQHQALYKQQQQPLAHVHLQQQSQQQQQQLSQQHFQQQQQLNQHQFQQQQQLNQQQFQQQQCQQECQQQQQQQCQQGQRVFGQNLMDNVYVNLFDNMSPLQQQMSGNTYFKLLDTSNLTVDGNIYVKVPQSELLCTPSAGMIPTISHAPAFFKVLDPSMITPKSGITQNQVFFKVFDSDPNANKIYVHSPLKQQQRGEKAVLVQKALGEAELQQLHQSIKVLDRDMLIDAVQQQPTLGATRVLYQTTPSLSPLQQLQQQPIQVIETCPTTINPLTQQQGNVVFLNQGMDKQWFTIPAGQAYSSEHGNLRLKIAIDPAEALNKQLIHQQQQQGEWIAVNPAHHQGTMFLNITVENPLKSRL